MVMVKYSETFDLSTQVGKLGLIGIHTPDLLAISTLYPGLLANNKFVKFDHCDVNVACASMLPADPLQIGVESGDIAPQDMFNPILYTAVSNDSMNTLQARIMMGLNNEAGSFQSISSEDVEFTLVGENVSDKVYYGLLAEEHSFKKAMPQAGLSMKGLYPIVYSVVSNYGNMAQYGEDMGSNTVPGSELTYSDSGALELYGDSTTGTPDVMSFRGPSMRMPRLPTLLANPTGNQVNLGLNGYAKVVLNSCPKTYVGAIVMPPAKLTVMYFRLRVTWYIEFSEIRAITDLNTYGLFRVGATTYNSDFTFEQASETSSLDSAPRIGSDYVKQSAKMTATSETVDTLDVELKRIM